VLRRHSKVISLYKAPGAMEAFKGNQFTMYVNIFRLPDMRYCHHFLPSLCSSVSVSFSIFLSEFAPVIFEKNIEMGKIN
jgi:hypothetical protein